MRGNCCSLKTTSLKSLKYWYPLHHHLAFTAGATWPSCLELTSRPGKEDLRRVLGKTSPSSVLSVVRELLLVRPVILVLPLIWKGWRDVGLPTYRAERKVNASSSEADGILLPQAAGGQPAQVHMGQMQNKDIHLPSHSQTETLAANAHLTGGQLKSVMAD